MKFAKKEFNNINLLIYYIFKGSSAPHTLNLKDPVIVVSVIILRRIVSVLISVCIEWICCLLLLLRSIEVRG